MGLRQGAPRGATAGDQLLVIPAVRGGVEVVDELQAFGQIQLPPGKARKHGKFTTWIGQKSKMTVLVRLAGI